MEVSPAPTTLDVKYNVSLSRLKELCDDKIFLWNFSCIWNNLRWLFKVKTKKKKKIWGEISWIITSEPTSQFLWVSAFILKSLFFLLNDRFNETSYESWNFNGFLIGTLFDGFWLLCHDYLFAQNVWTVVHLILNF